LGFLACAAIVRRSAYLQVGGFSPVVFFLGEETVLAQDLAAAGWGLAYVPGVVAHHHPRPGRSDRTRLQARNALLSTILRRPARVVLGCAARLLRSGDPRLRGAVWDAVRRLPQALRDRSPLPPEVEAAVRLLEGA
jgi:GT2 family glycosyltransferase